MAPTNQLRPVLESLGRRADRVAPRARLKAATFLAPLPLIHDGDAKPLFITGYSPRGEYGNYGKTGDSYLFLSEKPLGSVDWYIPGQSKVDFLVLFNFSVRPWHWTILERAGPEADVVISTEVWDEYLIPTY